MIYKKKPSKYAETIKTADAVTIERQTAFPEYYNNRNEPNTIEAEIEEEEDIQEAIKFISGTEVVAESKKGPSLTQPFGYTNKDIDIDMSLFKNTCLENIVLTDNEIGMLRDKLKYIKNPKKFIKTNMPYYCDIRNIILSNMPNFEEKFPSIFSQLLSECFENSESRKNTYIENIINLVVNNDINTLETRELYTRSHPGSTRLSSLLSKYNPTPSLIPRNKNGGTRRKRKNKRKTRKNKRKTHRRIK